MSTVPTPQVKGIVFKSILLPMFGIARALPQFEARVRGMEDQTFYDGQLYVDILGELSARIPPQALTAIGFNAVVGMKELFIARGFTDTDKAMVDASLVASVVTQDLPPAAAVRTVEYAPGRAVIESYALRPRAMVEGYVRGFVICFGHFISELDVKTFERDGEIVHQFTVTWT